MQDAKRLHFSSLHIVRIDFQCSVILHDVFIREGLAERIRGSPPPCEYANSLSHMCMHFLGELQCLQVYYSMCARMTSIHSTPGPGFMAYFDPVLDYGKTP